MSNNIIILDTETTSLDRPFCYDVGYVILNVEDHFLIKSEHYVIEQTWHNLPLFESAYYKEKRPLYVNLMRTRQAKLVKWGHMTQALAHDIKKYDVSGVYAYNSPFDDKTFAYNCDWFKTANPLDNIPIYDIKGYANTFITNTDEYKQFCEEHKQFTEKGGNYSATAESVYRFIMQDTDFNEDHMGLMDSEIEAIILLHCLDLGAELNKEYPTTKIIYRLKKTPFVIKLNGKEIYKGEYIKKYERNNVYNFTIGD